MKCMTQVMDLKYYVAKAQLDPRSLSHMLLKKKINLDFFFTKSNNVLTGH
jgi:hypothetical protein